MFTFKKPDAHHTINISYDKYQRLNAILIQQNKRLLEDVAHKYKLDYDELIARYIPI